MRLMLLFVFTWVICGSGCGGGGSEPVPVTNSDAIRKEQERLRSEVPLHPQSPGKTPGR